DFLDEVFSLGDFTQQQIKDILDDTCIKKKDGRKNRTLMLLSKSIEIANGARFKDQLFIRIAALVADGCPEDYPRLDSYTGWLISQLAYMGYSRKFIKTRFRKCQH